MRRMLRIAAQLSLPTEGVIEVHTTDISLGGLGVVMNTDPAEGVSYTLRVVLPRNDRKRFLLQSQVVVANSIFCAREAGFKVGLRFVGLDATASLALSEFFA